MHGFLTGEKKNKPETDFATETSFRATTTFTSVLLCCSRKQLLLHFISKNSDPKVTG